MNKIINILIILSVGSAPGTFAGCNQIVHKLEEAYCCTLKGNKQLTPPVAGGIVATGSIIIGAMTGGLMSKFVTKDLRWAYLSGLGVAFICFTATWYSLQKANIIINNTEE